MLNYVLGHSHKFFVYFFFDTTLKNSPSPSLITLVVDLQRVWSENNFQNHSRWYIPFTTLSRNEYKILLEELNFLERLKFIYSGLSPPTSTSDHGLRKLAGFWLQKNSNFPKIIYYF